MVELISIKSQSFSVDGVQSTSIGVDYNVPQGSVLGSLEFIFYTEDVVEVFTCNLVRHHLFADDKQLYWSGNISNIIRHQLCCCVTVIRDWCSSRRLQLNALKTELQWFGSRANLRKLSSADLKWRHPAGHGRTRSRRLPWQWADDEATHQSCCQQLLQLRQLRQIRCSAGENVINRLVTALVLSRLDYCNAILTGLPESTIRPLQRVQDAAAHLITETKSRDFFHYITINNLETFQRISVTKVTCTDNFTF